MFVPQTLFVRYEGKFPFIHATVTDQDGQIKWQGTDTSIAKLIKEVKQLFRGYNIQAALPGVAK